MHRRQFLTTAAGLAAMSSLPIGSVRALAASQAGKITYGQSTSILTLDPAHGAFTGYPGGYEAALLIYDRLLDFAPDMSIVPQLAESYSMNANLTECQLKLRRGVLFHDGTPVNAAAVKANIERMMDKDKNPANRPLWDPISGVEIVDDTTIVIKTSVPFAQLPNTLAHGSGAIVSPTAIEKSGDANIAQNPVGAGPYVLSTFRPGQDLLLKAFDDYWGEKPAASEVLFQQIAEPATRINALITGSVDVIDAIPVHLVSQLTSNPTVEIIRKPGLRPIGVAFNLKHPLLADVKVRQALNLAVPVSVIAERVFFGYAKAPDSPLAFDTIGHATVGESVFNVEKAKALLGEAGYVPGSDGILAKGSDRLSLRFIAPEGLFPGDVTVAEIVAAAFKEIGVEARITKVETGAYWDAIRQDTASAAWDMAMFGFNPSNASGAYHLSSLFKSNKDDSGRPDVWNIARYSSPKVDELLVKADTAPDEGERLSALAEAQKLIWEDAPYLWLQINENISAVRKGLGGVELLPIVFTSLRRAGV